jgi:hypothetical protein
MASASITRNCDSGSSSGPPQARGIGMPNIPASFIAPAIRGTMRRLCSVSSFASRIWAASPTAACRIGESSGAALPAAYVICEPPLKMH